MKRPSFQFYPGDWLRDTALRSCSLEARGLWADMMCLMHDGTPYGYLKVNHKVILPDNLCSMVGITLEVGQRLLKELEDSGVFSKDATGCIYSRRMVRDEKIRVSRASGGSKGGNPILKDAAKVNLPVNHNGKPVGYPHPAIAEEDIRKGGAGGNAPSLQDASAYVEQTRKNGSDYTDEEARQAWLSFEATKDEGGNWWLGNRIVGDWRAALETRILDRRKWNKTQSRNLDAPMPTWKRLEVITKNIEQHVCNSKFVGYKKDAPLEKKQEYQELLKTKAALEAQQRREAVGKQE